MIIVPLQALPSQSLTITLDSIIWGIDIQAANGVMAATFTRANTLILSGVRCLSGEPLITYRAIESGGGNFAFDTPNDVLPNWNFFGDTHILYYFTAAEVLSGRAAS